MATTIAGTYMAMMRVESRAKGYLVELLYTPNSPYSRITRVSAMEHAIDVAFVPVAVRESADVLLTHNPAGKVPSLVLDDGHVLGEARIICEFFDSIGNTRFVAPVEDIGRRCVEGIVSGFLDGIAVWTREARRVCQEQSPGILQLERERASRCLRYFERNWNSGSVCVDFASVALASAIELMDTRLSTGWRLDCPRLLEWFLAIMERPSLRATQPLPVEREPR